MDKVLFAQRYEGASVADLDGAVEGQDLDWRVGYLAMVADFIPYAFAGVDGSKVKVRDELELKLFMEGIQKRVRARRALRVGT